MPIKTILLPLRESDMSEHMIESGMVLARQHAAHLDVLYVHPKASDIMPFATMGMTRAVREMVQENANAASRDQAARLRTLFEAVRARHAIALRTRRDYDGEASADWSEAAGVRSEEVARRGRLADLILAPRPERYDPPPKTFEAILRDTGRALVMLPRGGPATPITGNVLVGWNGSTECASALAASRAMLRQAREVTVLVSVKRQHNRPHGEDVVDYLRCHGVTATSRVVDMSGGHVGEKILEQCKELGIELLVVGGYSRTRMQELFLGGVTRYLIREARLPVFMVH
jgi:nucleotide-binding universal stress UspA family protein